MNHYAIAYTLSSQSHTAIVRAIDNCSDDNKPVPYQNTLRYVQSTRSADDLRDCIRRTAKLQSNDHVCVIPIAQLAEGSNIPYTVFYD